jgi:hypothetical protein
MRGDYLCFARATSKALACRSLMHKPGVESTPAQLLFSGHENEVEVFVDVIGHIQEFFGE